MVKETQHGGLESDAQTSITRFSLITKCWEIQMLSKKGNHVFLITSLLFSNLKNLERSRFKFHALRLSLHSVKQNRGQVSLSKAGKDHLHKTKTKND
jgi:hypothetical protein